MTGAARLYAEEGMSEAWIIQEFMLTKGDEVGNTIGLYILSGTLSDAKTTVDVRMKEHFAQRTAHAVRVVSETGRELYRRTWWDEQASIQEEFEAKGRRT